MEMIEVKTAELIGPALEWAVAEADGHQPMLLPVSRTAYEVGVITCGEHLQVQGFACRYSTEWSQGGPLIEKHLIAFSVEHKDVILAVLCDENGMYIAGWRQGETHLIAACRAIVAAELGDTVRVPAALVGGGA